MFVEKRLIIDTKSLTPTRPDFEIIGVFNPAVTEYAGKFLMIARVAEKVIQTDPDYFLIPQYSQGNGIHIRKVPKDSPDYDFSDLRLIKNHETTFLTSVSHFRIGHSDDGVNFTFASQDIIFPDNIYEEYGIEDPRIAKIDDTYYVTFTAVSSNGINVRLMRTLDFKKYKRMGNILHCDNKDCVIFPEKINGRYFCLQRPSISQFGKLDIWLAESDNLRDWGNHQVMLQARIDYQESVRVGAGATPFLTDKGWIVIYHSADAKHNYHLTAMLLDKNDPTRVLAKSREPLVIPTETYEKSGFMNNVVFTCGLINKPEEVWIYYGVCDENIALCKLSLAEVYRNLGVETSWA